MFDIKDWRLIPSKLILELEKDLGCGFDLSITPMSNQRLVIDEQWKGFSNDLLNRPINQKIKVLLAGYKKSGKSTLMRYFINRCLKKWKKILVLDLDIGQSEFTMPGCVSAFIVDTPLLGPNFTHMLQPFKSYFFGSTDVTSNIPLYHKIVKIIVKDIENIDLNCIPCFINTMGFVEGSGLEILYNILSETKPSDVIQLKFDERQDLNLHSEIVNDNVESTLSYDLWYFISTVKNDSARAPQFRENIINKHDLQHLITTSYFSRCLGCTDIYFSDVVPYKINFSNISIKINDVEELTKAEYLKTINTNVIVLCVSKATTDLCECVGFGIVRNVNISTGDIYVVTPVAPDILNHVNQFRLWIFKYPPSTFYSIGTTNSKYCNVKQDNFFNENVARHYKVML
ncbi:Hypothetical protein CINCED_3A010548 [Cinara cedri]|nr:Hypothetical protein CINCED_3A010548 [Cinara cedri]